MTIAALIPIVLSASIFLIVFAVGLDGSWQEVMWLFRRPGLLVRSIVSMNILMVVFAFLMVVMFNPSPAIKIALLALAMSPVPPIFPKNQKKTGGTSAYGIGLMVVAALFSIVLVPLWLEVLGHYFGIEVEAGLGTIVVTLLRSILVPLFLGIVFRRLAPAAAERAVKPVSLVATVLLIAAVLPILFTMAPAMWAQFGHGVVWMMALFGVVGIAAGHLLGGPDPDNRSVLALATSARHPGIAMAIAGLNFPERKKEIMVVILYHLLVGAIVAIPYIKWRARQHAKLVTAA